MLLVHQIVKHVSSPVITAFNVAIRYSRNCTPRAFLSPQPEHKTWAFCANASAFTATPSQHPRDFPTQMYPLNRHDTLQHSHSMTPRVQAPSTLHLCSANNPGRRISHPARLKHDVCTQMQRSTVPFVRCSNHAAVALALGVSEVTLRCFFILRRSNVVCGVGHATPDGFQPCRSSHPIRTAFCSRCTVQ
jgi:hypothetical protein